MKKTTFLITALFVCAFASNAFAVNYSFDFTGGSGDLVPSTTFTSPDGPLEANVVSLTTGRDLYLGEFGVGSYASQEEGPTPSPELEEIKKVTSTSDKLLTDYEMTTTAPTEVKKSDGTVIADSEELRLLESLNTVTSRTSSSSSDTTSSQSLTPGLTTGTDTSNDDLYEIDGSEVFESVLLSFDHSVYLYGIDFASLDEDDHFTLTVDGIFYGSFPIGLYATPSGMNTLWWPTAIEGQNFVFGVADASDDYFLAGVHLVDCDDCTGENPVPEPATLLLLGTGLIGFGALRRKKATTEEIE